MGGEDRGVRDVKLGGEGGELVAAWARKTNEL